MTIRLRDDRRAVAEALRWVADMLEAEKLDRVDLVYVSGEVSRISISDGPDKTWRLPGVATEDDEQ